MRVYREDLGTLAYTCTRITPVSVLAYITARFARVLLRCEEENSIVETCSGREPPVGGFASAKPAALASQL